MIWWINLIVVLLFAVGYAARFIHPRHGWFFQLVAVFLPALVVLVAVLGVHAAVTRSWSMLVFNVCALVVMLFRHTPPLQTSAAIADLEPLTVISFNAKNREGKGDDEMVRLIRDRQPDIVAVQEAAVTLLEDSTAVGSERHLFPLIRHYGVRVPEFVTTNDLIKVHQPIFSRLESTDVDQAPIRRRTESRYGGVVTITRNKYLWGGREIAVYNVHLTSFGVRNLDSTRGRSRLSPAYWWIKVRTFATDLSTRATEAERIRKILDNETVPFIVCGDFNSTAESWVYQHLSRGLQDAHRVAGRGSGATYHSRFPLVRIDYILASPEWHIIESDVLDIGLSDHRPVLTRLALSDSGEASESPVPENHDGR